VGTPAWSDRDYLISQLPEDSIGGTLVWRSSEEKSWLTAGTIKALKDCTVYVFTLKAIYGKETIGEATLTKLEREGWEDAGEVATSFPNGEDWQWISLKKTIKAGDVNLQLSTVSLGKNSVLFIFK